MIELGAGQGLLRPLVMVLTLLVISMVHPESFAGPAFAADAKFSAREAAAPVTSGLSQVSSLPARRGTGEGEDLLMSHEKRTRSFKYLSRWRNTVASMRADALAYRACLEISTNCINAELRSLRDLTRKIRGKDRRAKLLAVNKFFNKRPYKKDSGNFGHSDYWAAPSEFMRRSGDCEDYAIAKYFLLRELGFTENELRVVVVFDSIENIGHAVLAVYEGNDIVILDNRSNLIFSHRKYRHYRPRYSMSETTYWDHRPAQTAAKGS